MNPNCVYIGAPKEVMLTNKDFHDCTYWDKSVQFCNYSIIVDINQPRVIQLWTRSGDWNMLAEKIPFATKCYENESIEAGFVRIVKSPTTLAWVKRHFGYAILKETEEELREMWKDMLSEDRRVTRPFYKESKHYIDFEKLEDEREAKWDKETIASANKSFKKHIQMIHNPDILQDSFDETKVNFMGYYSYTGKRFAGKEEIILLWNTGREERGFSYSWSEGGSGSGSHSFENLKKYKKLTKAKFLEKFLEINELSRLKEIEDEKRRKEWKEKEGN